MTQQYLVGQFSVLLDDLQPASGELLAAIRELRTEVEHSPVSMLPGLAREAVRLTDTICWRALERGDVSSFRAYANRAAALGDFIDTARLRRE